MKIAFTVDDLSPLYSFDHLDILHDTFNLKFDAFIPTNHFGKALLSDNLNWVDELKKREWISPNIHGIKHMDNSGCSIEYINLDYKGFMQSIGTSIKQFNDVSIKPYGIKAPGWDVNSTTDYIQAIKNIGLSFVCLHRPNEPLQCVEIDGLKTFGYTHCIHETFEIKTDCILHSHIHPSQGKNGLTNELTNYILYILNKVDNIEPVFLKDVI